MDYGYEQVDSNRGILTEVHIADLHFGAFDPSTQYKILKEQFFPVIAPIPKIDIISVDGDIFDRKVMSNSDVAMYASMFVDDLVKIARDKQATLVLIHGTYSHDFDQLKLFYHYLDDNSVDIRIVTNIKFEYIKGARILCIPEQYGLDESVYRHYLFESGWYDAAFVHGTYQGSVYKDQTTGNGRLLTEKDFIYCKGIAVSGHIHTSGCFNGFYYYCGSPYRWKFGEEEDKGFLILSHDLDTQYHYVQFEKIESFRYDTIYLDELISEDPKEIIDYINNIKESQNIDFIKVRFRVPVANYNKTIINNYYRNNKSTIIEYSDQQEIEQQKQEERSKQFEQYDYLTDKNMSDFERFVKYVNDSEGYQFITVDELTELLKEEL